MKSLHLKSSDEIQTMRKGGAILASIIAELTAMLKVGLVTWELQEEMLRLCEQHNVSSGTLGYKGYKGALCVSINDELVHGLPSKQRSIADGDVVKLDAVIVYDGFYLDMAVTRQIGNETASAQKLINITEFALKQTIGKAKPGYKTGDLGATMQGIVELAGLNVVRTMSGHGIGRSMHEEPDVLCYGEAGTGTQLQPGMVIAIEPMVLAGNHRLEIDKQDGWTARSADGSLTAHFEHTVAVTENEPIVLTAL